VSPISHISGYFPKFKRSQTSIEERLMPEDNVRMKRFNKEEKIPFVVQEKVSISLYESRSLGDERPSQTPSRPEHTHISLLIPEISSLPTFLQHLYLARELRGFLTCVSIHLSNMMPRRRGVQAAPRYQFWKHLP
jgi:hypothetical protein